MQPLTGPAPHPPWSLLRGPQVRIPSDPPLVPQVYLPVVSQIPILGVPWLRQVLPLHPVVGPTPDPGPAPSSQAQFKPGRIPVLGVPWSHYVVASQAGFPPPPPPPTPPPTGHAGVNKPFVPRDVTDDPRLRRMTEVTSQILNSLMTSGQLFQTSAVDWQITEVPAPPVPPAPPGPVVTFNSGSFTV